MIELFAVGGSIIGTVFVAMNRPFPANVIWGVTNPILCYHNLMIGETSQAVLFGMFMIIAWAGVLIDRLKYKKSAIS